VETTNVKNQVTTINYEEGDPEVITKDALYPEFTVDSETNETTYSSLSFEIEV
jgi:hypothetical protein